MCVHAGGGQRLIESIMVQLNIELTDLARWAGQLGPGSCQGYRLAPSTASFCTDAGVLTHVSVLVW